MIILKWYYLRKFKMGTEQVGAQDEVSLILYDKDGKIKQISQSKKRKTKLESFINLIRTVIEKW